MGCKVRDQDCDPTELPRRRVEVTAFSMTETEITQEQYARIMEDNPSYFKGCPRCPVERVSWHEAGGFCRKLGGRLPTAAQWEYAARAGSDTAFACGHHEACLGPAAWYQLNADLHTHPVKQKAPNKWGLYDMTGNVWEWVQDWEGEDPEAGERRGSGDAPANKYKLLRGGDWCTDNPIDLRVSTSISLEPDGRDYGLGFRCAKD